MLVLPQAAPVSIHFCGCCTSLRDLTKDTLLRHRKSRKQAQHPAGIEPRTLRVLLRRLVVYICAATAQLVGWFILNILVAVGIKTRSSQL